MITKQLGDYDISVARTHGVPEALEFSKFSEMNGNRENYWIYPDEIKPKANDMIILDGCSAFGLDANNKRPIAESISSARVSGGYTIDVYALVDAVFMTQFFNNLCSGDTAKQANDKIWQIGEGGAITRLLLQGDENYQLDQSNPPSPKLPKWTEV
jgi:hypothetical protein